AAERAEGADPNVVDLDARDRGVACGDAEDAHPAELVLAGPADLLGTPLAGADQGEVALALGAHDDVGVDPWRPAAHPRRDRVDDHLDVTAAQPHAGEPDEGQFHVPAMVASRPGQPPPTTTLTLRSAPAWTTVSTTR